LGASQGHKGQHEIICWASQHLNIQIGIALRSDRWVGADLWQRAADRSLILDALLGRSEVVVVGIDRGGLQQNSRRRVVQLRDRAGG